MFHGVQDGQVPEVGAVGDSAEGHDGFGNQLSRGIREDSEHGKGYENRATAGEDGITRKQRFVRRRDLPCGIGAVVGVEGRFVSAVLPGLDERRPGQSKITAPRKESNAVHTSTEWVGWVRHD